MFPIQKNVLSLRDSDDSKSLHNFCAAGFQLRPLTTPGRDTAVQIRKCLGLMMVKNSRELFVVHKSELISYRIATWISLTMNVLVNSYISIEAPRLAKAY